MSDHLPEARRVRPGFGATIRIGRRLWWLVLLPGFGLVLLLLAAGCGRKTWVAQTANLGYLGNAACAPCHAQEFDQHRASHHAVTMRPVDPKSMGAYYPAPGPIEGTNLAIYETTAGLAMGWKDKAAEAIPMQFALGSERYAFTYIHIVNDRSLQELRESYYPPVHAWLATPGQDYVDPNALAELHEDDLARSCLGCHTTTLPANGLTPEPRFYGVGCESCHGPGQKHVEAVRAGETGDLHMAKLEAMGATKLNELCGRCHRTAKTIPPNDTDMTQRFEPYGLMKSRCFLETGDTLSCMTCHNPHTDASADLKGYEKVCLNCHSPSPAGGVGPRNPQQTFCPVSPLTDCIPCHMPKRHVTPDSPFQMTDHYIRIFRHSLSGPNGQQ